MSQDNKVRILQYIGSLNSGGSQSMIMNIYRNIDRTKIQFDFIIDRKNETLYKKEIESLGGKVYIFEDYFKGYNYRKFTKQWKDFFNKHPEYKIIHCHIRSVASIVFRIAKKYNLKTICHSHSTSNGKGIKAIVKKILQNNIKHNCDYFFACSQESAEWLYGEEISNSDQCQIINNAIDASKYRYNKTIRKNIRKKLNLDNKIIISQIGRLEPVKNHIFSIDLLKDLLNTNRNYHLLIIGSGSQKDAIIEKAQKLDILDSITILENRNDVNELLQAADIYIMPSLWEGLPVSLIEAQAASLPCIISDTIKDGILTKKLVHRETLDTTKWIKCINKILSQEEPRSDSTNIIAKSGFDIKENIRLMEDFYIKTTLPKITFCLGSMNHGGAERVVANLSNYFADNQHDISIITTIPSKSAYQLNNNIKHLSLDQLLNNKTNIFSRTIKRTRTLRKLLKTKKPDIVISFLPEPSYRLMVAKTFLPIKTIISVRNDPNKEYDNLVKKLLVRILYTRADGFVFQTPDAQKWFPKKIQKKSVVIPNPINENFICKPYSGKREKVVVTVGRLVEQKNHKLLIDAFNDFHKIHKDYKLKIIGEGELRKELENHIKKLKLTSYVKLVGETKDVKKEIYKASMFVLTSDYEGMPNALMEAIALGVPCISTDCPIGGPKFLIKNNENGLLVKIDDRQSISEMMKILAENKEIANNISTKSSISSKKFSPSIILKNWEEYTLKILENQKDLK